jgi:hypothetical protein
MVEFLRAPIELITPMTVYQCEDWLGCEAITILPDDYFKEKP